MAPVGVRRLLPWLPGTAGALRPDGPTRPRRRRLGPDLAEGLRPQDRPVLRHRLAAQLLAHRSARRARLRMVREQVPGLVRRIRRLVGALSRTLVARSVRTDRVRSERLRLPAAVLVVHAAVRHPRRHGARRDTWRDADLLLGDVPLDRPRRLPRNLRRPAYAGDGSAVG